MNVRSLQRCLMILALAVLTACAGNAPSRSTPRAAETRESLPSTVPSAPEDRGELSAPGNPILREELPPQNAPSVNSPVNVAPAPVPPAAPRSPAAILLAEVDAAVAQGDLERAAAICERALRIEPRDAYLWYRLAYIRAQQGRVAEADGFARRALSFSTSNPALTRQINELLGSL